MKCFSSLSQARAAVTLGAATALLLVSGCATYQQQTATFTDATKDGSLTAAVADIEKRAEQAKGSKDEVVWRLEQGLSLRSAALANLPLPPPPPPKPAKAGEPAPVPAPAPTAEQVRLQYFERSIAAFDLAENRIGVYDEQAKVKLGSEIGAAFTNLAQLPYRGRAYDKIMLNAYKGVTFLELGDKDKARVEFNRCLERQREAVADNERRIVEAQALAEKAKDEGVKNEKGQTAKYDVGKAMKDPKTGSALDSALNASIAPMKPYGDYVNPYAVFLDGLFFSVLGENGADWERGRKSFERVASLVPENAYVKADLAMAASVAEGKVPEGITYIIFETGAAPVREEVRIDVPMFVVTDKVPYVGAAFPKLKFSSDYVPALTITSGTQSFATAPLASMDSIVANEFKNEWPTVVAKTLISTATKALSQAAVQKELDDRAGAFGSLLGKITMTVLNVGTTIADTRTWTSLPKEFQYARVPTPASRELTISAGGTTKTITLGPGAVNIVYAKSTSPRSPLYVSQFALR